MQSVQIVDMFPDNHLEKNSYDKNNNIKPVKEKPKPVLDFVKKPTTSSSNRSEQKNKLNLTNLDILVETGKLVNPESK